MEHIDELPVMVVQMSANFLIEDINQAVTDKLAYAIEEATGRPVLVFMTEQTQALARTARLLRQIRGTIGATSGADVGSRFSLQFTDHSMA
jgi:hypothetical protein